MARVWRSFKSDHIANRRCLAVIRSFFARLHKRHSGVTVAAATAVAASLLLVPRITGQGAVPPPPANPTSADQIQNIDQVKTAIRAITATR
jgi:hypothetical protein